MKILELIIILESFSLKVTTYLQKFLHSYLLSSMNNVNTEGVNSVSARKIILVFK